MFIPKAFLLSWKNFFRDSPLPIGGRISKLIPLCAKGREEQENSRIFYCLVLVFCGCMAMKRRCGLGHIGWSPVIDRMMLDRVLTARLLQG